MICQNRNRIGFYTGSGTLWLPCLHGCQVTIRRTPCWCWNGSTCFTRSFYTLRVESLWQKGSNVYIKPILEISPTRFVEIHFRPVGVEMVQHVLQDHFTLYESNRFGKKDQMCMLNHSSKSVRLGLLKFTFGGGKKLNEWSWIVTDWWWSGDARANVSESIVMTKCACTA